MGWKKWPYWLRGGILAIGIGFVLFLIGIPLVGLGNYLDCPRGGEGVCKNGIISTIGVTLVYLPTWSVRFFRSLPVNNSFQILIYNFMAIILPFVQLFVIGALIGFIVGKIKNK